jgi:hypothetical protein
MAIQSYSLGEITLHGQRYQVELKVFDNNAKDVIDREPTLLQNINSVAQGAFLLLNKQNENSAKLDCSKIECQINGDEISFTVNQSRLNKRVNKLISPLLQSIYESLYQSQFAIGLKKDQ